MHHYAECSRDRTQPWSCPPGARSLAREAEGSHLQCGCCCAVAESGLTLCSVLGAANNTHKIPPHPGGRNNKLNKCEALDRKMERNRRGEWETQGQRTGAEDGQGKPLGEGDLCIHGQWKPAGKGVQVRGTEHQNPG